MTTKRVEIDFDHHSKEFAKDPEAAFRQFHRECPIAWTPKHEGFWVVTRYEDVKRVAQDDFAFSSRHDIPPNGPSYTGVIIPPSPMRGVPIETDPPEFYDYRRILNRKFSPAATEALRPKILEYTTECLDRVMETGRIDLVLDLANPVPAMLTLDFLGVPVERWEEFADPIHVSTYTPPEGREHQRAMEGMMQLAATIGEVIEERKKAPRDDLVSYLIESRVNGQAFTDQEIVEMCFLVVAGGVDTTTALMANAFEYLDRNPEARRRLMDDPDLLPSAVEEFLRVFTPVQGLARTATKDVSLGGQTIREGERLLLCWGAANRDPEMFDRPDEVVLDRFPNRHTAFGLGSHRCLGSSFARAETEIVLGQVLERIPDYELVRDELQRYETIGQVNGYVKMPARFSPKK